MLKECLPHMRKANKGQLIIVTSLGGFQGFPFSDAYSASKFALEGNLQMFRQCPVRPCRAQLGNSHLDAFLCSASAYILICNPPGDEHANAIHLMPFA